MQYTGISLESSAYTENAETDRFAAEIYYLLFFSDSTMCIIESWVIFFLIFKKIMHSRHLYRIHLHAKQVHSLFVPDARIHYRNLTNYEMCMELLKSMVGFDATSNVTMSPELGPYLPEAKIFS